MTGILRYRGPRHLDRTLALELGEIEGPPLEFDVQPTIDGGLEALLSGECDLAEIPLGALASFIDRGESPITGVPVFLSRRFPHRYLWVEQDSPFTLPGDLQGKTVGWAPGAGAAAAWSRHLILAAEAEPRFVAGTMGGSMAPVLDLGREPSEKHLPAAVWDGDIDALATPYPVPAADGGDRLRPLIPDRGAAEREWVQNGGSLPMTTVVAARKDALDKAGVERLVNAFSAAKKAGSARLRYPGAPAVGLPWLQDHLAELDATFETDPFLYGIEANRSTLDAFLENLESLGSVSSGLSIEVLFTEPEIN